MNMLSNMRLFTKILYSLSVALIISACSGTVDENSVPVLTVSSSELDLAGGEEAVFTVTYNGVDVTSQSSVFLAVDSSTDALPDAVFTPQTVGEYVYVAEYNGKLSNTVTVKVIDTTPVVIESKYRRQVCVVEMTGAWCINCPRGYQLIYEKLSIPSYRKYKEMMHLCAFHSDLEGTDTLAISATQDLAKRYNIGSYPSYITDFRTSGLLTEDGINEFVPSIKSSVEDYPAHCGVAVSSVMNADKTQAEITVKVTSELTSDYRVVVMVVQNQIVGYQKTTMYPEGDSGYIHNHVVRQVVTSYEKTFTGEMFGETALIEAGQEKTRSWTIDVPSKWVLENTEIYAVILDADGYANNMNVCAIDGGDSGYDLI